MALRPTTPRLSNKLPPSSRKWLDRQFRDPYVKMRLSSPAAFRSRSAYKLLELDGRWKFLTHKDVNSVVDLGAAPGGWSQVVAGKLGWSNWDTVRGKPVMPQSVSKRGPKHAAKEEPQEEMQEDGAEIDESETESTGKGKRTGKGKMVAWSGQAGRSTKDPQRGEDVEDIDLYDPFGQDVLPEQPTGRGTIIAVDLLRMEPIHGVQSLQMDFLSPQAEEFIDALLRRHPESDGKTDVILSDMAANFTGNHTADIEASMRLNNSVFEFVKRHLRTADSIGRRRGGVLVLKTFEHPVVHDFKLRHLEPNFNVITYQKPSASRSESSEGYLVCLGWKGAPAS